MKTTIKTRMIAVLAVFMLCALGIKADETVITQQITVKVESPGNLKNQIGSTKAEMIANLKLTGDLNSDDIRFVREMAGRTYNQHTTNGKLEHLDLSEANIVKGGLYYYTNTYAVSYYANDNVIGYRMFMGCNLKSIKLPKSTKIIDSDAFREDYNLEEIEIPEGVEEIGGSAFYMTGLTNVYIPNSVSNLGECFTSCKSLKEVHLPEGIKTIGGFSFCEKLEKVNMPNSIEKIESYAFENCKSLQSIDIPSSVKEIKGGAFDDCTALTAVNITNMDAWSRIIFNESSRTDSKSSNPVYYAKHLYLNGKEVEDINIPSDITEVSLNAYCGITSAKKAEIHSNVTSIGNNAFYGCTGMEEIRVHAQKPPKANKSTFEEIDKQACTLYVPRGTYLDYFLAEGWGDFLNIIEFDATGIDTIAIPSQSDTYYNTMGNKSNKAFPGLNIIRKANGETYKIMK